MDVLSYLLGKNASGGDTPSGGIDWSLIGYSEAPQSFTNDFNYAKDIYDNWENVSELALKFKNDAQLVFCPLVDTSNATIFNQMFYNCTNLIYVPVLNTANATGFNSMFSLSIRLNDEALDNILQMCINATSYTGIKTLKKLGFQSADYSSARFEALPHWQDFTEAGWTTGY